MNSGTLLSVIMPVYNGELYLKEAIESVLNSDYQNLELIIVDDGSKDGSESVYRDYASKDHRVRIIKKSNGGIADARNCGLNNAKGDYFAFIDQDDKVAISMYSTCIARMQADSSDMCVSNYYLWRTDGLKENTYVADNGYSSDVIGVLADLTGVNNKDNGYAHPNGRVTHCIWNCVYRSEVIQNKGIRFFRFVDYEDDYIFNINYVRSCRRISFESSFGYYWRQWGRTESSHHKYIEDVYHKRSKFVSFLLDSLSGYEGDLEQFRMTNLRKTILWSFYNESMFQSKKKCKIVLKQIISENRISINNKFLFLGITVKEKVFLYLLINGWYSLAYYLNRFIIHSYYH